MRLVGRDIVLSEPYEYYQTGEGIKFFTKHGITYSVVFRDPTQYFGEDFSIYIKDNVWEILFEAEGGQPHIHDVKVAATLMHVVRLVLSDMDRALFYFCDFSDGKEKARAKLFERWISNDRLGNLTLIKRIIKIPPVDPNTDTASEYFFGLLLNTKSLLYDTYNQMFSEFIEVYSKH